LYVNGTLQESGGGKVLQVVSNSVADYDTMNNAHTSPAGTPLTATITPTLSTSKILIMYHANVMKNNRDMAAMFWIYKSVGGGSFSSVSQTDKTLDANAAAYEASFIGDTYLDSPATTSSVQYKVYAGITDTAGLLHFNSGASTLTMTLMEIGA